MKSGPSFAFDGINDSLRLTGSSILPEVDSWEFKLEFNCRQPGHGDRSGRVLAQVITHHEEVILVKKGLVPSAVVDDERNELIRTFLTIPTMYYGFNLNWFGHSCQGESFYGITLTLL